MGTRGALLSHIYLLSLFIIGMQVEPPLGSPTVSSIRGRAHSYDLHEQLTVNHDSRFFAAYIFSLFFFIPARGDSKILLQQDTTHFQELKEGKDTVIWDYAVAAIALAVKVQGVSFQLHFVH